MLQAAAVKRHFRLHNFSKPGQSQVGSFSGKKFRYSVSFYFLTKVVNYVFLITNASINESCILQPYLKLICPLQARKKILQK